MRTIRRTKSFKRDLKREKKGRHSKTLASNLTMIVGMIASDATLPKRHCDHTLVGNWKGYRDCHINPDLLLIYKKTDDNGLDLVRLGSHSELGL